jgi:hypothetical protein
LILALVFIKERGLSPASLSSIGVEELSLEALHLLDELLEGEDGVHKQGWVVLLWVVGAWTIVGDSSYRSLKSGEVQWNHSLCRTAYPIGVGVGKAAIIAIKLYMMQLTRVQEHKSKDP